MNASLLPPAAPQPTPKKKILAGTMSKKVGAVIGGAALVAGISMGGATSNSANSRADAAEAQADKLQSQIVALASQLDDSQAALAKEEKRTQELITEITPYREKAAAEKKAAEEKAAAEKKAAEEKAAAEKAAAEQAAAEQAAADKAAAEAAAQQQQQQSAPVPFAGTQPQETYYANCTAARNAGAAPIRAGQPGYSRKLDRDGDGIACE